MHSIWENPCLTPKLQKQIIKVAKKYMEIQEMVQGTQLEKDESFASQLQVLSQS
jgi:septum formation topological specificity factor MinE